MSALITLHLCVMCQNQPMNEPDAAGVISKPSSVGVSGTVARLRNVIEERGLTLFAEIDHQAIAQSVGLQMRPAHVLIFGNAKAGTPLMVASPLLALDLPLKVLVWEDSDGETRVSYNSTAFLADRYGIPDDLAKNIAGIDNVVEAAVGRT